MKTKLVVLGILCLILVVGCYSQPDNKFTEGKLDINVTIYPNGTAIERTMDGTVIGSYIVRELIVSHVYNPERLKIIERNKEVTGVIQKKVKEKDGDSHYLMKLDPKYEDILTPGNINHQNGSLVLEDICRFNISQSDALVSCDDFKSGLLIPEVGKRYRAIGDYVMDIEHYSWAELHPLYLLEEIK